jgi:Zinc finger, C3HC4 type (RING finger)
VCVRICFFFFFFFHFTSLPCTALVFVRTLSMAVSEPLVAVRFLCVAEGSRLRVRVITPGYQNGINCQFPRAIREEGGVYWAPASAVTLARQGAHGTFFYRVTGSRVQRGLPPAHAHAHHGAAAIASGASTGLSKEALQAMRVFGDDDQFTDCVVCMDRIRAVVLVPCGHFNLCAECAHQMQMTSAQCPMCRGSFTAFVSRDQCQGWEEDTALSMQRSRSLSRSSSGGGMLAAEPMDERQDEEVTTEGATTKDEAEQKEAAGVSASVATVEEVATDDDDEAEVDLEPQTPQRRSTRAKRPTLKAAAAAAEAQKQAAAKKKRQAASAPPATGPDGNPVPRGRGRPRKVRTPAELAAMSVAQPKRRRGRPRKIRTPEELAAMEEAAKLKASEPKRPRGRPPKKSTVVKRKPVDAAQPGVAHGRRPRQS